jgi:hypothetical protein
MLMLSGFKSPRNFPTLRACTGAWHVGEIMVWMLPSYSKPFRDFQGHSMKTDDETKNYIW